jgi:Undecaprenyl-phosphate glucose phosphotransferase
MFIRKFSLGIDDQYALTRLLRIADIAIVVITGAGAYWARHGIWAIPDEYIVAIAIGALLTANYIHLARLYEFSELERFALKFGVVTASWLAVIVTMLLIAYFSKLTGSYSRVWGATWFVTAYILLVVARGAFLVMLDKWQKNGDLSYNIVVVGAGEFGEALLQHLGRQRNGPARVIGLFDDRETRIPDKVAGHSVKGTIDDLLLFVRSNRIDQIVIALPWSAHERLGVILQKLATVAIDVKLCPSEAAFKIPNMGFESVAGIPMLTILKPPLTGWSRILKAVEDHVLGAIILLIIGPLMLFIALGIMLTSGGPVLFRQQRYGFNNNEFTVFKFRSMISAPQSGHLVQARRDDPRVTSFGRFLRRTSLDELPQLFNVMRGEMALVGPRPHAVEHNEEYAEIIDRYLVRHKVKPGITGWAQVNGFRGETSTPSLMHQRVQHDLQYIENWSFLFDLKILALTLFIGFMDDNAY